MMIDKEENFLSNNNINGKKNNDDVVGMELEDLPEETLVNILSFLPTKTATRISVLSKRWRFLWNSIPRFDFKFASGDHRYRDRPWLFRNFVEKHLLGIPDCSTIRSFEHTTHKKCDDVHAHVENWLSIAVKHRVERLGLYYFYDREFGVPDLPSMSLHPSLFICVSLTELTLYLTCPVNGILKTPPHICLPNLETLTLRNLSLARNLIERLLSGCPVLKELILSDCCWDIDAKAVRVTSPSLESLCIYEYQQYFLNDRQVVIHGPNLKTFNYFGQANNEYCLSALSLLLESSINIERTDLLDYNDGEGGIRRQVSYRAHKLISGLSDVRNLYLSRNTIQVLEYSGDEFFTIMPTFSNLTVLRVTNGLWDEASGALRNIRPRCPRLTKVSSSYWSSI